MNHIRLATLKDQTGAGKEYPFAVQVSQDTNGWMTVGRFKTDSAAIIHAKDLSKFIRSHQHTAIDSVLWGEDI